LPKEIYQRVFENNRKWVKEMSDKDPSFFEHLAESQQPEFLYIGCADSRVPANTIMGLEPGEVFVHRNIANLVVSTDLNCQSVIEYAVNHLHVKHIIVCGHYGCGGVKAAMQSDDLGLLNGWLREVRDVFRLFQDELMAIEDEDARYRRLVELNALEQARDVMMTAAVQKHYGTHGYPIVHAWCYDLADGELRDLELAFDEELDLIHHIYALN